jgi:hypothetical protein
MEMTPRVVTGFAGAIHEEKDSALLRGVNAQKADTSAASQGEAVELREENVPMLDAAALNELFPAFLRLRKSLFSPA